MPAVRLLNSALMPIPGVYVLRSLTPEEFGDAVARADACGRLISYIGYPQTADIVSDLASLSGFAAQERVDIPVSREQTPVNDSDELLIARLRYRVGDPHSKGQAVDCHDFEYFRATYRAIEAQEFRP